MVAKTLYLVRGVSGAGKTEFARNLLDNMSSCAMFSADDYFDNGRNDWHWRKLEAAHTECRENVHATMSMDIDHIFVCNTMVLEKELDEYYEIAAGFPEYRVVSLIIENRHNGQNVHGVPDKTCDKMRRRFQTKL